MQFSPSVLDKTCCERENAQYIMDGADQQLKVSLLAEGGIELFIQSGRIPSFTEGTPMLIVPPAGTQRGDGFRVWNYMDAISQGIDPTGWGDMGTREYLSPEGVSRGFAHIVTVSDDEFDTLHKRYEAAMDQFYPELKETNLLSRITNMMRRR